MERFVFDKYVEQFVLPSKTPQQNRMRGLGVEIRFINPYSLAQALSCWQILTGKDYHVDRRESCVFRYIARRIILVAGC